MPQTRSNMGFFGTTEHVTPKSIVRSCRTSTWFRDFMPAQIICKSHKDPIKMKQVMLHTRSNMVFFGTQGQVTLKWSVQSGQNSNLFQILWLSWLPASLKMNRWKVLSAGQHFLHNKSKKKNFIAQGQVTPRWIVRSGLESNSPEHLRFYDLCYLHSRAGNSKVRSGQNLTSSKILWLSWLPTRWNLIQSKVKALSSRQHFVHYKSMGKFFVAQGQVPPKWMVWSGLKSNSPDASMTKIQSKIKLLFYGQHFPHYKSMWAIGCHGKNNFEPICPKGRPFVYYKLVLWAFGSGELKKQTYFLLPTSFGFLLGLSLSHCKCLALSQLPKIISICPSWSCNAKGTEIIWAIS